MGSVSKLLKEYSIVETTNMVCKNCAGEKYVCEFIDGGISIKANGSNLSELFLAGILMQHAYTGSDEKANEHFDEFMDMAIAAGIVNGLSDGKGLDSNTFSELVEKAMTIFEAVMGRPMRLNKESLLSAVANALDSEED